MTSQLRRLPDRRGFYPALLVVLWIVMNVIVDPRGDFPLNDDWDYGVTVQKLVEGHGFYFPQTAAPSLIAHLLFGVPFCAFGFSFTALRIATETNALIGVLALYVLVQGLGAPRYAAFMAALTLATSPLYFHLAHSFMSDVPYVATTLLAVALLARGMRTGSTGALVGGIVATTWAALIRQSGLEIAIAFAITALLSREQRRRHLVFAAICVVVVVAALRGFDAWLTAAGQKSPVYGKQAIDLSNEVRADALHFLSAILTRNATVIYVGFFIAPLLILVLRDRLRGIRLRDHIIAAVAALAYAIRLWLDLGGRVMPLFGNCLVNVGFGPVTIADYIYRKGTIPRAPLLLWQITTTIGFIGAVVLVYLLVVSSLRLLKARARPVAASFAILLLCASWVAMPSFYWDRYLVIMVPLACLVVLHDVTWSRRPAFVAMAAIAIALQAWFSVAGERDYLTWNCARWAALNELTNVRHIAPTAIDGGFEFNALHLWPRPSAPGKSSWWVQDDKYIVTFGPLPGYHELRVYPFTRWLTPSQPGAIHLLERD